MPLNEILQRIEEETRKEEENIIREARSKADAILNEATKKSEIIFDQFNRKAKEDVENIRREKISSLTLEGRNLVEKEIEKIERKYEDRLRTEIEEFKKTEEYKKFLISAVENSWKKLGPGSVVYVNPQDADKVKASNIPVTVITKDIDPIGGVIVTSGDGKIFIDSTLSEIMKERREKILKIARSYIR